MYKISVPIMNDSVDMNTRDVYLKQMKAGYVARVFLVVVALSENEAETEKLLLRLRDNIAFFEQNGIEAGIWLAETIGHGSALALPGTELRKVSETPLMNLSGEQILGTHCPLDPAFRRRIAGQIARLAQTGAKTILLDDDFRLSVHGLENKYLCACDLHMAKIRRFCGEDISREELEAKVFRQKANKYRAAWLRAQGESLRLLAEDIRAEMDKAAPDVRIAYCAPPMWDTDGCSPIELSRVLGGKHPPLARLCGAPYWAVLDNRPLSMVFETARMHASFCKGSGLELMAEGDVYPRPRHIVPASCLELYDAVIRADGQYHGILKYMVCYTTSPEYDIGYINRHISNLQRMEQISALFAGKTACGVGVPVHPHQFDDADFSLGVVSSRYPYALAGSMLASLSIPTTYENNGVCPAVFGEEARHIPVEQLKKGAILDGVAAVLLTERGIDVGLSGEQHFEKIRVQYMVSPDGAERIPLNWRNDGARQMRTELSAGAEVLLSVEVNGERSPMVYRYQNADGQRFTVFLADTMAMQYTSDLRRGDLMQDVMLSAIEWISGEKLPAVCPHNPDLYLLCRQGDGKLAVGLFNCFADSILQPVITLDRNYSSIRFVGCDGRLEGDQVYLNSPLNAFEFAAFEVTLREAEEHPE